jgi:hypothetical protein
MYREIALYDTVRQEWARTEARLQLERKALATRQRPALGELVGRMARLLKAERTPAPEHTPHTPTHRAPLAS